jgi:DNA-binding NarL/FixJ family response regulator
VLRAEHGFGVVGEAADGREALRLAQQLRPDVVLMDVRMPVMDGLAATRALRVEQPEARVVMLSSHEDRALVLEALRAGALGYLLKGASKQEVLTTLRAILGGERRVQGSLAADLLHNEAVGSARPSPAAQLSQRELDVLRLLAQGYTNAAIGYQLQVSVNTVKTHLRHVLRKLDVPDRAAAAARAAALGLLEVSAR